MRTGARASRHAVHANRRERGAPSIRNGDAAMPDALHHCKRITRSRARNFYYGLKLLPEPQRSAMYALYAWMRAADDLVDSGMCADGEQHAADVHARIEAFRHGTTRALAGDPPAGDPMWTGLAFAAGQFNLSEQPFHAMLAGQLDDLRERTYDTFDQLREYCYRVASTVGLLCIEIWGYTDTSAKDLAIHRGIAFQLTNILRDFREDYDAGRVYLPREDFEKCDMTPQDLRSWSKPSRSEAFIVAQVERASSFYESSARLDQLISPQCLPTLWAMTTIYRSLLRKIGADPSALVGDRRVRLSFFRKSMIALRARTGRLSA